VAQERARLAAPEDFAAVTEKSELERLRWENAQLRMDNKFSREKPQSSSLSSSRIGMLRADGGREG
jgi:hypothetical protein